MSQHWRLTNGIALGLAVVAAACGAPVEPQHAVGEWTLDEGTLVAPSGFTTLDYLELGVEIAEVAYSSYLGTPQLEVTPGIGIAEVNCMVEQVSDESVSGTALLWLYQASDGSTFDLEGDWRYERSDRGEALSINMSGTISWEPERDLPPAPVIFSLRAHR